MKNRTGACPVNFFSSRSSVMILLQERTGTMMKQWIEDNLNQQIEDLLGLLRIPSVSRGTPEPGMPLGKDVYHALEYAVDLAHRLGFDKTQILDGYCATVDYGEGDEMLMIMAHLDVVPAGPGWETDPFDPVIKDGYIYARGVYDDKSAAVSSLYALAAVKNAGIRLNRRIRIFLGGDEEKFSACIDRYKETEELPTLAFTPDASYPVVNSEMNILHATYHLPLAESAVSISCGTAANVVPGTAEAVLTVPVKPCAVPDGYSCEISGNSVRVNGLGGHAAMNDLARNALQALMEVLSCQPLPEKDQLIASGLHALLGYDLHGEGFGLDVRDESGALTLSPDILQWDHSGISLTFDCRYPFCITCEEVLSKLDAAMGVFGFRRGETHNSKGHYIPRNSELVSTLLSLFEKHTGAPAEPISMGGGTYARGFENAVAFGIEYVGEPSECHMPNEKMAVSNILFNTLIFADAIAELGTGKNN